MGGEDYTDELRKIAQNDCGALGDTSILADPSVVADLVENRMKRN